MPYFIPRLNMTLQQIKLSILLAALFCEHYIIKQPAQNLRTQFQHFGLQREANNISWVMAENSSHWHSCLELWKAPTAVFLSNFLHLTTLLNSFYFSGLLGLQQSLLLIRTQNPSTSPCICPVQPSVCKRLSIGASRHQTQASACFLKPRKESGERDFASGSFHVFLPNLSSQVETLANYACAR